MDQFGLKDQYATMDRIGNIAIKDQSAAMGQFGLIATYRLRKPA